MMLVDGAGHALSEKGQKEYDELLEDGMPWIEVRAFCKTCRRARCFLPKRGGP